MSGSAQHHENSVQQNLHAILDLTDDHDDSVDPPPSTSHRLPADAPPAYPRRDDLSSVAYAPPPAGHPTFPSSTPGARPPQPPQPGYSPNNISQRYAAAAPFTYAANRQALLDQSKVAPRAGRHSEPGHRQPPPPPPPAPFVQQRDQSSFNANVGSSLRVPRGVTYTAGPARIDPFQPRHASAIAQAPPPVPHLARQHSQPRHSHPPAAPTGPRFAANADLHSRVPNPFQPPPPPHQPPVRRDFGEDESAKSPPRKAILPPGFTHQSAPYPGFVNTFVPASSSHAAVHDHRRTDSPAAAAADALDLRSPSAPPPRSPPPPPPARQHFGSPPDMSRNGKGTPITPRDPSAVRPGLATPGWNTGFDDDDGDAPPTAARDKGKGRAAPQGRGMPVIAVPRPGRSERDLVQKLHFKKNAQSAVSSSNFHDSPHASTSASGSRTGHPAGGSSSASRQRVMHQDDPQTAQEMRGEAEMKRVEKEAKAAKKKPAPSRAPAAASGGTTAAKGRGKKKALEVVELSSSTDDDDDDDDDPIRTSDDDRAGSSRAQASSSHASTSGRPTLIVKGAAQAQARQQQQQQQQRGESDEFSDDELAIGAQPRRTNVDVKERIAEIEHKVKGKTSVASSLKPKTKPQPRVDGGPTDGGELDILPAPTAGKKMPRAAQESIDKGKGKAKAKGDSVLVEQVKMVPIEGFLVGRKHVPHDYRHAVYTLLYSLRGKPKITVRCKSREGEAEDVCDFTQKDVDRVMYSDVVEPGHVLYVEFAFKKSSAVFEQLAQVCDASSSDFDAGSRTVVFPFSGSLTDAWEDKPRTPIDHVFNLCVKDWKATKTAKGPAGATKSVLDLCRQDADELADKLDKRRGKLSNKGKQSQQKLVFGPAAPAKPPRLHTDAAGDWVEADSGAPRRSSRATNSAFAGDGQVAAAREALAKPRSVSPHGAEKVVLEYPMGEPGAVSVTWGDTKRLRDEEFLNDTLIEYGLKRILKSIEERDVGRPDDEKLAPQIHVFNSFFYKQLSSKKDAKRGLDPYRLVEKWTKRVDLFKKRFIVVPINEYLHWYLAIIVNPGAILNPPPPAPPPAAPRKSGRKRNGTVDSDFVVDSPGGSPEVASKHFGGAGDSLREADVDETVADEDPEEQAARQANEKVARDVAAHEQRKAHDHDREVQAAVASVAEQERRASASAGPVDEMDLDDGARVASSSAVIGSSPRRRTQPSNGAEDDEAMLDISSQSPPPPGQHDVHMHGADDMSDVDIDVRRVRPEVEGGGPGKPDKHVVFSPTQGQGKGQHTRFPADDADDDDVVVVQEEPHERAAAAPASDASDASLEPPDKLGKGKQRLRRGSKKEVVAAEPAPPPEHAEQLGRITLEDDEDESLSGPGDLAPTSAPMQKATSSSSAVTSTSGSSTSAATVAADTEPTSRSAPASTTYGSASSSRPRKSVVVGAPMPFAPQDPEPEREAQLARERAEEEERRRAQAAEEVEMSEEVTSSADRCWILTFDSLGAPHKQVANRVKDYLRREAVSKRGNTNTSSEQAEVIKVEVPQQPNSCDCGLYLLHFVDTFFKNPQLFTDTAVSAHLQAKSKSKDKGKKDLGKKELESQAFDLWEGHVAQQKRAAMRTEVEQLSKAWLKDMEPQREKERLEREERKRLRAEERNQDRDRKAAERAAEAEAEEQHREAQHRQASSSAAAAAAPPRAAVEPPPDRAPAPPPPAAASSPATSRVPRVAQAPPPRPAPPPPPAPPSSLWKAKDEVKASAQDELILLSDSESAPTSSSHPVAEQASTTPTAPPPAERIPRASTSLTEPHRQHDRPQPPADSVATSSTTKRRRETSGGGPALGALAVDEPFSVSSPHFPPAPVPPAPAAPPADSPDAGVVDSQSLPLDGVSPSSSRNDDAARRPHKRVKVRHAPADSPREPFSLPGSQSGALVDYGSASEGEGEADGAGAVVVAEAQEPREPTPPPPPPSTQKRAARSEDFAPMTRLKSVSKAEGTETMVLEDDD